MKSCWILEDEVRNLSIYNWQNNLLSCRNTAILCKLCFTAPKQWKVIKPDEVHSASWGRWCLQAVAEARKLIPLNFSQHWKKPIENRTNVVRQRKVRLSLRNTKWWGRQRITGCTLQEQSLNCEDQTRLKKTPDSGQTDSKNLSYHFLQQHLSLMSPQKYIQ